MTILRRFAAVGFLAALIGCGTQQPPDPRGNQSDVVPDAALRPVARVPAAAAGEWSLAADRSTLTFDAEEEADRLSLVCPGDGRLRVTLPAARAIASEERLSVGGGGEVEALVAEQGEARGGVSAVGAVPASLGAMLRAGPGASYGATSIGPLPAVSPADSEAFVASCRKRIAAPAPTPSPSPCHVQDGRRLAIAPLRALGTEPFWGAIIDGRCVTYSTPDDPAGERVWTRVSPSGDTFVGALGGRPFRLMISRGWCSDGMSDREYPMRASLAVGAEERTGCALPR
jgi:uncharacterized membrane protein